MVDAVHIGDIARLSLVRMNLLSKSPLRPGWRQVLQYKSVETGVQFTLVCLTTFVAVILPLAPD